MSMTITASHGTTTRSVQVASFTHDTNQVMCALGDLFGKFDVPPGTPLLVEGYGHSIEWPSDGFLLALAARLVQSPDEEAR